MNIRVDLNYTIKDGSEIVFRSPVDCSAITGLVVYYVAEDGSAASREFVLTDAHGHDVGDIDHLFSENVVVKVILDVTAGKAYVLNADTNAYIESSFIKKTNGTSEFFTVTELGVQDHTGDCKFTAYWEEEITDENGMPTGQVFSFYGAECDESVVLRGIHDPIMNHDAATKRYVDRKVAEVGNGSGQNADLSTVLETVPSNNLLDVSAAVGSFVDSTGAVVTGSFSNYIPVRKGLRYVTNMAPTDFCWFDEDKQHLSTKFYTSSPKILEPEQDGFLLVRLPANASGSLVLEGTDIGAHRPEHPRLKPELLPNPWAGKRCLVVADSNGEYVRPGFAELVSRDLGMALHNISAGGQTITGGMAKLDTVGSEFDLVLVMLGTNDQGYNNTLGAIDDTSGSYYANLKAMIAKLKAKFPTSVVMLMTMFKRTAVGSEASNNGEGFWINGQGLTTEDYRDAVIEVCGLYSIPCIDLYNTIDLRTEADRKLWALAVGDGTHPNAQAHAVKIAPVVKAGILAHTPYVFPKWSEEEPDAPVEPEEPDEPVVPVTYTITNNLTNVTTSNSAATVNAGTAYTARLSAAEGYAIDAVTVTMGGADVTADSYADGIVSIAAVTGNVVITAAAVVAEAPDDGTPKLIHAWGTGVFNATLEDTVGNWDLTFWNEGHGADNIAAMALEQGQSFSVRSKVTRQTTLYRTNHHIHSGRNMGITLPTNNYAGHFWLGLVNTNIDTGAGYGDAQVQFYYLTANNADAKSEIIKGMKTYTTGDVVEIAMTWDADTSTVRVYEDGILIGEQVTSVPLKFDGLRIQANYHTDEQAGSCPAEYVEIWRGVAEI